MRTLVIGDIHGCHTALITLLNAVKPAPEDTLVFLGDYIDRGPASRQVIETLLELRRSCSPVFLRGNHEIMILEAREDFEKNKAFRSYGGVQTLQSYDALDDEDWAALIPAAHWEFFERTEKFFETGTDIFVHGCAAPDLGMREQPDWIVYWEKFDRLRPHKSGKRVICGHTPQHSHRPKDTGFGVCIDTGAVYLGWLTCLDANSGRYWQADERGNTREGLL